MKAFAKINLGLRILGKRPDGFHDLDTIFARIGLADDLEFCLRQDGKIIVRTEGADIPEKENLVWKAAWLLQKFSPKMLGVEIQLKKRIPLGAGLGGGSSDAATTLRALNKLWRLRLPLKKLESIALSLGSDVPFFLSQGVRRGRGRGEILEEMKLPKSFPREVLLVVPNFSVETKWAFSKISNQKIQMSQPEADPPMAENKCQNSKSKKICQLQSANCELSNDFEKVIFREFPELRRIKNGLLKSGAELAALSGSGSAVFGLFRKQETAKKALKKEFDPPSLSATADFHSLTKATPSINPGSFRAFGQVFLVRIRE